MSWVALGKNVTSANVLTFLYDFRLLLHIIFGFGSRIFSRIFSSFRYTYYLGDIWDFLHRPL